MFKFFSKHWSEFPLNRKKNGENKMKAEPITETFIEKKQNFSHISGPKNLEEFYDYIKVFPCDFKKTAKNTVIFSGNKNAKLMIIGEAPGAEEDEQGEPFVGASGQLLNNMLKAIDIERENVYITNVLFWRPPMNRTPTEKEILLFLPLLEKHIDLYKPEVIFLLGSVALRALFGLESMITKMRGNILNYKNIPVIATFHPSYILRLKKQKVLVWQDLQILKKLLQDLNIYHNLLKANNNNFLN